MNQCFNDAIEYHMAYNTRDIDIASVEANFDKFRDKALKMLEQQK
jgi:hypothetical protein